MTEKTDDAIYNGGGLKGPLYWLAGAVTGKLVLVAMQGNGAFGTSSAVTQAANAAVQYEMCKKDAEIVQLKAAQETDKKLVDVYKELRAQDKTQDATVKAIDSRLSALETSTPLREQLVLAKVGEVASLAQQGIATNSTAISSLAATVNSVVRTVIPNTSVCPGWGTVTVTPQGPFPFPPPPPGPGPTPA